MARRGFGARLAAIVPRETIAARRTASRSSGDPAGEQERGSRWTPRCAKEARRSAGRSSPASRDDEIGPGIEAARDFQLRELIPDLRRIASTGPSPARRGEAMQALAAIDPRRACRSAPRVARATPATPVEVRESAAITLANLERPEAQAALLEALPTAPERLQSTIAAALARRRKGPKRSCTPSRRARRRPALLQERPVVIGLENAEIAAWSERIAALLKGLPPADQKLKELLTRARAAYLRSDHDPARGASVFEKNCGICHQLEGKGRRSGPQLDGIGSRGLDRLLEDMLDPNRNVDQSFRVTNLALRERPGRLGPAAPRGGRGPDHGRCAGQGDPRARRSTSRSDRPPSSLPCRRTWPSRSPRPSSRT